MQVKNLYKNRYSELSKKFIDKKTHIIHNLKMYSYRKKGIPLKSSSAIPRLKRTKTQFTEKSLNIPMN